jgi:hypothetical protein
MKDKIAADLEANWAVVAEAIQNILRREGYPKPYEALKALTRTNSAITASSIAEFIDTLDDKGYRQSRAQANQPEQLYRSGTQLMLHHEKSAHYPVSLCCRSDCLLVFINILEHPKKRCSRSLRSKAVPMDLQEY